MYNLTKEWCDILAPIMEKQFFIDLTAFLEKEYLTNDIYPPKELIFNALNLVKPDDVKVVILGQDPYHQPGQAHGLSFSVTEGTALPPSLQNIFKEIKDELGIENKTGDLTAWAKQGVLLLNTVLTVKRSSPNSHKGMGWGNIVRRVMLHLNDNYKGIIFVLWGKNAQEHKQYIDPTKHHILQSAHPSPFSAHYGFFKNGHFKKINELLISEGKTPIDFKLK